MKKLHLIYAISLFACVSFLHADPVSRYSSGRAFQDTDDWYAAIESYQEALKENPAYYQAWQGLAECFYSLGEYDQALTMVLKAEEYRKNDPVLLDLRAFIQIGLGNTIEASSLFRKVLEIWPNDTSARFGLAEIEIAAGRMSSASSLYVEALSRNPENRKALLSLAVLSREAGNTVQSKDYINRAMKLHGDSPEVFYFAALVAFMDNETGESEKLVRRAIALKSEYPDAHSLLSGILYRQNRFTEVIAICDTQIQRNRNNPDAWYLRTLSLEKNMKYDDAIRSAQSGLQVSPGDEILRSLMENIIIEQLSFEDSRRAPVSIFHSDKAREFESKNMSDQALYEYRRALKINPYDIDSRQAYAKILLSRGLPGRQIEQLEFVQALGKSTTRVNDAIESYKKLLSGSVPNKWSIDPLTLDKVHTKIGLFYLSDFSHIEHPDSERITTNMVAEVFSYLPGFRVSSAVRASSSYSEAFRKSRESGDDYFGLVRLKENERDIQIIVDLYVSKTGAVAKTFTVFRTGNDKYSNAIRRLVQTIAADIPIQGSIVKRFQGDAVISLGKADGIAKDQVFDIVPVAEVSVMNEGLGITWKPATLLGTFTVTQVDEDMSMGKVERSGFYDRINAGDTVLIRAKEETGAAKPAESPEQKGTVSSVLQIIRKIR